MSDEITIRQGTPEDAPAFLALVDALAEYEELGRPSPEAHQRLVRDGFGERRLFTPWLAELQGRVAGYAMTFHTYSSFLALPTLYLEDVFVLPEVRGRGVGRAFFRFLARQAVREGCGRMEWVVLDWNRLAIDFYERLGATRLTEWHTYRLTGDQLERIAGGER